jgi:hypothetical protein
MVRTIAFHPKGRAQGRGILRLRHQRRSHAQSKEKNAQASWPIHRRMVKANG